MATSTYTCDTALSSASFRSFGSGLSAALAAVGCIKTSDTGQINWTTATFSYPSVSIGYEIWRFNDTLQSTAPIFFKIIYGSTPYAGGSYRASIQAGQGSDGAGNLTGKITSVMTQQSGNADATVCVNYVSMTDGRLTMALLWKQYSLFWMGIERSKNSSGVEGGDGAYVYMEQPYGANGGGGRYSQYLPLLNPAISTEPVVVPIAAYNINVGLYGDGINVPIFPMFPHYGGILNPAVGACYYGMSDISSSPQDLSITHYGVARNMKFLGNCRLYGTNAQDKIGLAIIWE